MSGYSFFAHTIGRQTTAEELPEPWIIHCSCGHRQYIQVLGAYRELMNHVRNDHWLPALLAWNLK